MTILLEEVNATEGLVTQQEAEHGGMVLEGSLVASCNGDMLVTRTGGAGEDWRRAGSGET